MANVIGDIAGNYKTLLALIKKMPDDEVISAGDMVDRGPRSKEVLDFFMDNGRAIMGNHEHIMLDSCRAGHYYQHGLWEQNGGMETQIAFNYSVPQKYLHWIADLPLYLEIDDCLVSHAFIDADSTLEEVCDLGKDFRDCDFNIMWNRTGPIPRDAWKTQIAGHNAWIGLRWFYDNGTRYAVCIDTSKDSVLTGINTKTLEVYQQEVID